MTIFDNYEVWFVIGSQHLYGPEALRQVTKHAEHVVNSLNAEAKLDFLVFAPSDISIRNGQCCSMNFMKVSFSQSGSFQNGKQRTNFACCPWTLLCDPAVSHTVRDKKDNDQTFLKLEDS